MVCNLICGFRGSGKDELHKAQISGLKRANFCLTSIARLIHNMIYHTSHSITDKLYSALIVLKVCKCPRYIVYSDLDHLMANDADNPFLMRNFWRDAFADDVKALVCTYLGLAEAPTGTDKDSVQYTAPDGRIGTFRYFCICIAEDARKMEPTFWAKKVCRRAIHGLNYNYTDFRKMEELIEAIKTHDVVYTTRIYRSSVPIPPNTAISEHDLHNFKTDFLVLTSFLDFNAAVELYPQYKKFKLLSVLY